MGGSPAGNEAQLSAGVSTELPPPLSGLSFNSCFLPERVDISCHISPWSDNSRVTQCLSLAPQRHVIRPSHCHSFFLGLSKGGRWGEGMVRKKEIRQCCTKSKLHMVNILNSGVRILIALLFITAASWRVAAALSRMWIKSWVQADLSWNRFLEFKDLH